MKDEASEATRSPVSILSRDEFLCYASLLIRAGKYQEARESFAKASQKAARLATDERTLCLSTMESLMPEIDRFDDVSLENLIGLIDFFPQIDKRSGSERYWKYWTARVYLQAGQQEQALAVLKSMRWRYKIDWSALVEIAQSYRQKNKLRGNAGIPKSD